MPTKPSELIRYVEIPVTKRGADGLYVDEVEKVYYRPVTQDWLDHWAAQGLTERINAEKTRQFILDMAEAEGERLDAQKKLDASANGHRAELEKAVRKAVEKMDALKGQFEAHRQENPEPEYDLLSRQMAEILTDVGYLGEDGLPLPVTPETLAKVVDREYLAEVKEKIEKKLFRR